MFCPQCGSPIPAGESKCTRCSASAEAVSPNDIIAEQSRVKSSPETASNIPLTQGEAILWHRDTKQGVIHKEVTLEEAVTNKRCLKYDDRNNRIIAQVGIENMPEVVIMNPHRVNDSLGGGIFLTPRMLGLPGLPFGLYGGPRRGTLKISGDVSLIVNGKLVMTFENVNGPQGLRQLIQALKRQHMGPVTKMRAGQRRQGPFQRFGRQLGPPDTA